MIDIRFGDFKKVLNDIPEETIDTIITDPPYLNEHVPVWQDLAQFATEKLKPSGYLITYCGHMFLPYAFKTLTGGKLQFIWMLALKHQGHHAICWKYRVVNIWKPILVFQKEPLTTRRTEPLFSDMVLSDGREKEYHPWQQNLKAVKEIIETFTKPYELVCDPFLGSGTTAVACLATKRRFIGAEIDYQTYLTALERLKQPIQCSLFISSQEKLLKMQKEENNKTNSLIIFFKFC